MSARRFVSLTMLALMLTVPVAAQAKLPAPKAKTVVFGKSIAGVKLGASLADAQQAWGSGGTCVAPQPATAASPIVTTCTWTQAASGSTDFTVSADKVTQIGLHPTRNSTTGKPKLSGPITAFKTSKGIGIGSTLKALRKAYPKVQDGAADTFVLFSGKITTSFEVFGGLLSGIDIQAAPVVN